MKYEKNCKICDCAFIGTGPAAMYCEVHQAGAKEQQKKKQAKRIAKIRAETGKIKKPGSGKGGNPYRGEEHPSYRHGRYVFERLRYEVKNEVRYCERCDKDLIDATHYWWVVHHKDHNQYNNKRSNLELLCKCCHQIEHECHLAFTKGATTRE